MATLLFTLSIVLGLIALLGLIAPRKVIRNKQKASRGKVMLVYALPSLLLFIGFGMTYESDWDKALKNPAEVTSVSLKFKKLEELPAELAQMTRLQQLDLSKNKLTALPDYLSTFDNLQHIDLSDNPIRELPAWLGEMKSLKKLTLDNTEVATLPEWLSHLDISYANTPLYVAENPENGNENTPDAAESKDDREESLGEFAMRKFLGKDYGYRRKFKKGEIFYNSPVTKEQVDTIGEFMLLMNFFNDEREASMLLDKNKNDVYELKIVVVSERALTEEVMQGFQSIKQVIQQDVFPNDVFHLVLTDGEFDTLKTLE